MQSYFGSVLFFFLARLEPKTPGRTKLYRGNVFYTRPLKVKMRRRPVSDPNVFSAFLHDFSLEGFWGISVCAFSPSFFIFLCAHAFPINARNPSIKNFSGAVRCQQVAAGLSLESPPCDKQGMLLRMPVPQTTRPVSGAPRRLEQAALR